MVEHGAEIVEHSVVESELSKQSFPEQSRQVDLACFTQF